MSYTEAQKKATIKYLTEKTDDIRLRVTKGTKDRWRHHAEQAGQSMTSYVCDAVESQIKADTDGPEIPPDLIKNLISWLRSHDHTDSDIVDCIQAISKQDQ